jgi:hypothetical protein
MIRTTASYKIKDNLFDTKFTAWSPEEKGKVIIARLSTSRKCDPEFDKKLIEDGIAKEFKGDYYVDSNWSAVFIGEAFNRAKKHNLSSKDKIVGVRCDILNEPYINKDNVKVYNNPTLKIYDFEFDTETNNNATNMDTPPVVVKQVEEEEMPY